MPKTDDPVGYGRKPSDGPTVSREEVDARQARKLNQTDNGVIENGKIRHPIPPHRSSTTNV